MAIIPAHEHHKTRPDLLRPVLLRLLLRQPEISGYRGLGEHGRLSGGHLRVSG